MGEIHLLNPMSFEKTWLAARKKEEALNGPKAKERLINSYTGG